MSLATLYTPASSVESGPARETRNSLSGEFTRFALNRSDWTQVDPRGIWMAAVPWAMSDLPVLAEPAPRLLRDSEEFELLPDLAATWNELVTQEGFNLVTRGIEYVVLQLEDGAKPAKSLELEVFLSAGEESGGRWRIAAGPLVTDGFYVRPAEAVELTVEVPEDSVLRYRCSALGLGSGSAELRVLLDGELLDRVELTESERLDPLSRLVALPEGERRLALLRFETDGAGPWIGIHVPVIGPARIGTPSERPSGSTRPNLVVFLADTFRADNLSFYGSDQELTPRLDAFAEECVRFSNVLSSSSWTLPSHASLFFGLAPPRHGVTRRGMRPAETLVSLAEQLSQYGYRTAAVTDASWVSRLYGFDQGFEWFEEHSPRDMESTLNAATRALEEDDGRPLFLFVHTYRVHRPFVPSPETLAAQGARLGIERNNFELGDVMDVEIVDHLEQWDHEGDALLPLQGQEAFNETPSAEEIGCADLSAALTELQALYRGGVIDLDRSFGDFLDVLEGNDQVSNTFLVFTSDHGEAFGEHVSIGHGLGAWQEQLRIPLFIRGPRYSPRDVDTPGTLEDVARTLAEAMNFSVAKTWEGASLFSAPRSRPVFAFDCSLDGRHKAVIIDQDFKLVLRTEQASSPNARILHAYDLRVDREERRDLSLDPRARELLDRRRDELLSLLEVFEAPYPVTSTEAHLDGLRALGYAGDESSERSSAKPEED